MMLSPFREGFEWLMNIAFGALAPGILISCGIFLSAGIEGIGGRWGLPPERHRLFRIFALIVLIGIIAGAYCQGSFLFTILAVGSLLWFFLPLSLILGVLAFMSIRKVELRPLSKSLTVAVFASAVGLVMGYCAGLVMNFWEISAARNYVGRAIPLLETAKLHSGAYPTSLPVSELGTPPLLLRGSGGFTSDGKSFSFEYADPAGMMDSYVFTSESHDWVRED